MSVLRYRYRPKAIQPEMIDARANASHSLAKKEKPAIVEAFADVDISVYEEPVFLPSATQVRRIEVMITSDEEAYRRKHQPTIMQRVEMQKEWAREQLQRAKFEQQRAIMKQKQIRGGDDPPEPGEPRLDIAHYENELLDLDNKDALEMQMEMEQQQLDKKNKVDFAAHLMDIKERKIMTSRDTSRYHRQLSRAERRYRAFLLFCGVRSYFNRHGATDILPWLVLGRRETASVQQTLIQMGITHILNLTLDCPNLFDANFVYLQIPVKDSIEEDIGKYFKEIINFIKRAEACKGRVLVHCNAGASRAPTAVLAYLVFAKNISLCDAYNYITALRPLVRPNNHFLFQLAMLEVQMGLGCSVYFHNDWRFYEFNVFRAEQVPMRRTIGVTRTVLKLYDTEKGPVDLLAKKLEVEDS